MAAATRTAADAPLRLPGEAAAPASAPPSEGGSHHGAAGARRRLGLAHSSTPTMADLRDAVAAATASNATPAGAPQASGGAGTAARDAPARGRAAGDRDQREKQGGGKPGGRKFTVQRSCGSDPELPHGGGGGGSPGGAPPCVGRASPFAAAAAAALEPMPQDLAVPDHPAARARVPPMERIVSGKVADLTAALQRRAAGAAGPSGHGDLGQGAPDASVAVAPGFTGAWGVQDARPAGGGLVWRLPLDAVAAPDEAFKVPLPELQVAAGALIKTLQQGGRAKASAASFKRMSAPGPAARAAAAAAGFGCAGGEHAAMCASPLAGM
jgi:hypothetical protein